MCVIAVAIKSELPLNVLRACESSNPHGGGCSWIEDGMVRFVKNVRATKIAELLAGKPLPHVVHFRIATVGGVQPRRCHPFTISGVRNDLLEGVAKAALYHNGHCSGWEFYASMTGVAQGLPSDASDSMAIARMVAVRGEGILQELVNRNAGKFAVMHKNGEVKLYGRFEEHDGAMFSNLHWKHGLSCNPLHNTSGHFKGQGSKHGGQHFVSGKHHGVHQPSLPAYKTWWERELGETD